MEFRWSRAPAEVDGGFLLSLLPGRYALTAARESPFGRFGLWFELGEVAVQDGATTRLDLRIPAGSLTVKVTNKASGRPRAETAVQVEISRDGRPSGRAAGMTDVDGEHALTLCPVGAARIWVGERGSRDPDAAVEVVAGKAASATVSL
ncbi:MAG TPA: hypothetical protein VFI25_13120 [Planctomycetota bacterium]|nr:hypothetical protein [Planctomycetota bacterium]